MYTSVQGPLGALSHVRDLSRQPNQSEDLLPGPERCHHLQPSPTLNRTVPLLTPPSKGGGSACGGLTAGNWVISEDMEPCTVCE